MSRSPKFGTVVRDYLARKRRLRNLTENTIVTYEHMARHLAPIAHHPVDKLKPAHLENLYADLLADLAPSSICMVHRVANMALADAKDNGLVTRNVATGVDTPRNAERAAQATKIDGMALEKLIQVADRSGVAGLIVLVALGAGLRRDEIVRLHTDDFDVVAGTLSVLKGKTRSAKRTITLPKDVADRLAAYVATIPLGPIFPNRTGGRARGDALYHRVKAVLARAGLGDLTLHTLRHTHASVLLNAGVDEGVVARRLGHRDATITRRIYDHAGVRDENAAVVAIQRAMETSNAETTGHV